jgi:hypothetical protein
MKKFKSKFSVICEETLTRYQQSGFLCGDYVSFKKDATSHEFFKKADKGLQAQIKDIIESGDLCRISLLKSGKSETFKGPVQAANISTKDGWADIIHEYGPGRFDGTMSVPLYMIEKIDIEGDMNGYPQYSDRIKRQNRTDGKPAEVVDMTNAKDVNRNLPTTNTKL